MSGNVDRKDRLKQIARIVAITCALLTGFWALYYTRNDLIGIGLLVLIALLVVYSSKLTKRKWFPFVPAGLIIYLVYFRMFDGNVYFDFICMVVAGYALDTVLNNYRSKIPLGNPTKLDQDEDENLPEPEHE